MENIKQLEEELLIELLKLAQKEFRSINELLRLTKELGDASGRDDRVTLQMLLEMRKVEMDRVDGCKKSVALLIENAPSDMRESLKNIMAGTCTESFDSKLTEQIVSIVNSSKKTIRQTVAVDKAISQRMAGRESFYATQ